MKETGRAPTLCIVDRELSIRNDVYYRYGLFGATVAGALVLLAFQLPTGHSDFLLALLITALVAVGRSITFRISSAGASHMGTPALLVGVLLLEPSLAVFAVGVGTSVGEGLIRRRTEQLPFSIAVAAIQAFFTVGVTQAIGWDAEKPVFDDPLVIGGIFIAGLLAIALAGFLVSVAGWLRHEGPLATLYRELLSGGDASFYLIDVSKVCFGLIAAMLVTWSPIHILLIVVPVAAMSQALVRAIALRRQLERALHETEYSLAEAQRLAQLGSWEWEISSRYMRWSDQLFNITGVETSNTLVSLSDFRGLLRIADRKKLERLVGELIESQGSAEFDHEIVRSDGTVRHVHHVLAWAPRDERAEERLVGTVLDITERKRLEIELRHQAYHDGLTGLPNRELFLERLEEQLAIDLVAPRASAVIFLDLDHFKAINDRYGHETGDAVLIEIARRLESQVGPRDTAARLSGDEFTVLASATSANPNLEAFAGRLLGAIQHPVAACGNTVPISASAGLIYINRSHASASNVLRQADNALYRAKRAGRGRLNIAPVEDAPEPLAVLREPA